jgi:hypothetical protein
MLMGVVLAVPAVAGGPMSPVRPLPFGNTERAVTVPNPDAETETDATGAAPKLADPPSVADIPGTPEKLASVPDEPKPETKHTARRHRSPRHSMANWLNHMELRRRHWRHYGTAASASSSPYTPGFGPAPYSADGD